MTQLQAINVSASPERQANENFETLSAAGMFGKRQPATSGLTWGYYGGLYNGNTVTDGFVTLADNATNYVVVLRSTGVVSVSTTPTNSGNALYAKLYKLTTSSGVVTATIDQRLDANGLLTGSIQSTSLDTDGSLAANSDAVAASQKATKTYVDGKLAGLSWKQAVRAGTTAAGTLASSFSSGQVIDGVTLATGDRILIKNQAAASENGLYLVNSTGAPTRTTDADAGAELVNASVYVSEGTTLADSQWTCSTNAPITVGTTALAFAQMMTGSTFMGGTLSSALNEAPIISLASSATPAIGAAAANCIAITGTTAITGFDAIAAGARRTLRFGGALTLTHNATSLVLPTSANIVTAANDVAEFVSLGAGNWFCTSYQKASGQALAASGTGGGGGTVDPYAANRVLLLHAQGYDTSSNVVDSSASARTVSASTNAISTDRYRFGVSSLYCPGGTVIVSLASSALAGLNPGTGDFAIEAQIYYDNAAAFPLIFQAKGTHTGRFYFAIYPTDRKLYVQFNGADWMSTPTNSLKVNKWQHVVWSRVSGTSRMFVDGKLAASLADTNNYQIGTTGVDICGNLGTADNHYMQEVSMIVGAGPTAAFTPPAAAY